VGYLLEKEKFRKSKVEKEEKGDTRKTTRPQLRGSQTASLGLGGRRTLSRGGEGRE